MSHTYCSSLFHCVFSTKDRGKAIAPELQERLWAYMGGIARENGIKALGVGGTEDHAHLLLSLPSTMTIAEAMQKIKGGSSLWLHESCGLTGFEWQKGYGAFTIGISQVDATVAVYRRPDRAPSEAGFSGGVFGDFEAARDGIRSAVCLGVSGRPGYAISPRRMGDWGSLFPGFGIEAGVNHAVPTGRRGMVVHAFPGFHPGLFSFAPSGRGRYARAVQERGEGGRPRSPVSKG